MIYTLFVGQQIEKGEELESWGFLRRFDTEAEADAYLLGVGDRSFLPCGWHCFVHYVKDLDELRFRLRMFARADLAEDFTKESFWNGQRRKLLWTRPKKTS